MFLRVLSHTIRITFVTQPGRYPSHGADSMPNLLNQLNSETLFVDFMLIPFFFWNKEYVLFRGASIQELVEKARLSKEKRTTILLSALEISKTCPNQFSSNYGVITTLCSVKDPSRQKL